MIGLFSWCLRSNRGMHCVIIFAVEWLVVINNIEWRRARAVTFSVEFWRMLESTQTSQTCVLWDVPVFFSYTQGEKTSHTGLKFCPPPPPSPLHIDGQTRTQHSAKKSRMICKLINIDWRGGGRLANGIQLFSALLQGYSFPLAVFIIHRPKLNGSRPAGPKWEFCSDWPSCSEFTEIVLGDPFCVTKCPGCVYFFQEARKIRTKLPANPPLRLQTA